MSWSECEIDTLDTKYLTFDFGPSLEMHVRYCQRFMHGTSRESNGVSKIEYQDKIDDP
jgi:hypothetical protein